MTKLYSATNPQAIIDQFERMAQRADAVASAPDGPLRNKAIAKREAITWRAAADILRNTDFVGWLHDGMTVDEIKNSNTPEARAAWDKLQKRNTEFVGWAAEPPIVDHNAGRASWEKAARAAWDKLQKR